MNEELLAKLALVGQRMTTPPAAPESVSVGDAAPEDAAPEEKEKVGKQMAFWPEDTAAMPTELTRVSLFGLIRRGRRKFMDWEKLSSRADVEVFYFGKQLDQADADLWLACLRMGRGVPLGQRIYTTAANLLRAIGRAKSGASVRWLTESLDRMSGGSIRLVTKRGGKTIRITTGLLKYGIEEESGQMYIRLDPDGAALFENLAYVGWEQRLSLRSNAAKALQLYVSGHMTGKPHAVPLRDLACWMGYEGRLRQFRAALTHALDELARLGLICNHGIKAGPRGEIAYWTRNNSSVK